MSITRPLSRIRSITSARPLGFGERAMPAPAPFLDVSAVVAIYFRPPALLFRRGDDLLLAERPLPEDERPPLDVELLRDDADRDRFGSPPFERLLDLLAVLRFELEERDRVCRLGFSSSSSRASSSPSSSSS